MGRIREHSAEVTATRLDYTVERYLYFLTPAEQCAAEQVSRALREIAAGERIGRRSNARRA